MERNCRGLSRLGVAVPSLLAGLLDEERFLVLLLGSRLKLSCSGNYLSLLTQRVTNCNSLSRSGF